MTPQERAARIQGLLKGLDRILGVEVTEADKAAVRLRLPVTEAHHQIHGIVHGGLYCTLVESACSIGAWMVATESGQEIVGLDQSTSFLRAVRSGTLEVLATPLQAGRRVQLWQAEIRDDQGRLAATGKLRLLNLAPGATVGGEGLAKTTF